MTLRRLALVFILVSAGPTLALAQTSSATIPAVETGQKVWVTTANGEVLGNVSELSPVFIELATAAGIKRIAMSDVAAISKKDSNKQGFWIGAAVGCVVGSVVAQGVNDIAAFATPQKNYEKESTFSSAGFCVTSGLIFGGIGAWIDSLIEGRDVLYQAGTARVAVKIAPQVELVGSKRVGIGGSITWR